MAGPDAINYPTAVIPRYALSLVLRIDTCFSKHSSQKPGHGSGVLLKLGDNARFPWSLTDLLTRAIERYSPWVYVTCRHVMDYAYNHQNEYAWRLTRFRTQHFSEYGDRLVPVDFPLDDICVLVPENKRLDLALIAIKPPSDAFNVMLHKAPASAKLIQLTVDYVLEGTRLCETMHWGTEVGFTSIQPWTHGYPILRSGRLASDPRVDFVSPDIDRDDIYLLEALSFAGSSGAPVITYPVGHPVFDDFKAGDGSHFEKYRFPHFVGIMSGHIRNDEPWAGELHNLHVGLSYCHKASALKRMIFEEELVQLWP